MFKELPPSIVWFRQDLRIEDNPALQAALDTSNDVIPLFIWSPEEEGKWPPGGASRCWLHFSLESLSHELKAIGLNLVIRQGSSLQVISEVIEHTKAASIYWNRRYEPSAIERDGKIQTTLHQRGLKVENFNASLLYEPWTIANKQGNPFQVFTPFWKACLNSAEPSPPLGMPKKECRTPNIKSLPLESLELLPEIHWDSGIRKAWIPGAPEAKKILKQFIQKKILNYDTNRDRPDLLSVSHLSPYLHFGEISPRMVWKAVLDNWTGKEEGVSSFLRQLGWREFAYHLLFHFPKTPEVPLRAEFQKFQWHDNHDQLKAWHHGKTGYPFVDAGMRQLWTTGWMHNRVRLVVGSFLVKDLLISWQEGEKWFWDTLVDADLANNTMGWQWVGGCGADAAPYFRIFNPVTQGEKFDPQGTYVRKWIPELADLPSEWIHKPWEAPENVLRKAGVSLGSTYPHPIVDHSEARVMALSAFEAIKNHEGKG